MRHHKFCKNIQSHFYLHSIVQESCIKLTIIVSKADGEKKNPPEQSAIQICHCKFKENKVTFILGTILCVDSWDYCVSYSFYTCALLIHRRSFILSLHIFLILEFITLLEFDIHCAGIHDRCLHDIYI